MKKWINEPNRAFQREKSKKHMNKCSRYLATKEMQIKTRLRFHLTPVRTLITKNTNNSKCLVKIVEKGTLIHCW
jgi:hypothetical protein